MKTLEDFKIMQKKKTERNRQNIKKLLAVHFYGLHRDSCLLPTFGHLHTYIARWDRDARSDHGCFGRFQGCLDISANFNPGEWTEVVGKKGKKMRSKSFARSVALGPSNNQAGTNLRSAHAVPMSHVMSGGNQVRVPSTGFAYSGPGVKRTVSTGNGERTPQKRNFCEAWQQEAKGEAGTMEESAKEQ